MKSGEVQHTMVAWRSVAHRTITPCRPVRSLLAFCFSVAMVDDDARTARTMAASDNSEGGPVIGGKSMRATRGCSRGLHTEVHAAFTPSYKLSAL